MKLSRLALVLLCLTAVPAFAQQRFFDLTGWAAWVDPNSSGTFNSATPNQPFDVNFNGKLGYGAGANIFFGGRTSLAVDIVQVRPVTSLRSRAVGGGSFTGSAIRMTPLTGVLQFHFAPQGFVDPYIGAGAAYVLFDNVNGAGNLNLNSINFKDDVGLALNAGLGIRLSPHVGLTADGKYVPLKSSATAVYNTGANTSTRVKINPVIFSGGLTLRF
jgi:outer membrane protein